MDESMYRLVVSLAFENRSSAGAKSFARDMEQIEKQAKSAQKNAEQLKKALEALKGSSHGYDTRLGAQEKVVQYARQENDLRQKIALTTDASERSRLSSELKALGIMKEQVSVRVRELALQDTVAKSSFAERERARREEAREEARIARERIASEREFARIRKEANRKQDAEKAERASAYSTANMFIAPAIAGIAGGILKHGATDAANLEMALTSMKIATGADKQTVDALRAAAYSISNNTGQSVVDAAQNMSVLAGAGLNDPAQLAKLAPAIAQFADVQYFKNKTPFEESAKQGVQIAHLFNAYSEDKIKPILEKMTQVSYAMPDSLSKFLTQAGYYEPMFRALGVSDKDSIMAGAMIDRAGLGRGKGGTSLQNLLLNEMNGLALTGHVQGKRKMALQALGLTNDDGTAKFYKYGADGKGHFDILGSLNQISTALRESTKGLTGKAYLKKSAEMIMDVNSALGLTGERAALAISPEAIGNLTDALKRIGSSGTMSDIQGKYMNTVNGQWQRMVSNFSSFITDLMWPWLDGMRSTFKFLGDQLHEWQKYLHEHRTVAKGVGVATAGVFAVSSVLAIKALMGMFGGGMGIIGKDMLGGLGGAAKMGGGIIGLTAIRGFIGDVVRWAPMLLTSRAGAGLFLESLTKIGLRFIPVVGEVYMLIEAVKFLGAHSKDIGKGLAIAVHWIETTGWRMLSGAFSSLIRGMVSMIMHPQSAIGSAWDGTIKFFQDRGNEVHKGVNEFRYESDQLNKHDKSASGNHVHGDVHMHFPNATDPHAIRHAVKTAFSTIGNPATKYGMNPSSSFGHPAIAAV